MKYFFVFAFCCLFSQGFSQLLSFNQKEFLRISNFGNGTSKMNFDNQYNDAASGSAYYSDAWLPGQAVMSSGKIYSGLSVKIDLYKNKVFMDNHDTIYDITDVPQLIRIMLFPSADTSQKAVFALHLPLQGINSSLFQVLSDGKIMLVKQDTRDIRETQTGVNTVKEKVISSKDRYFIIRDNSPVEVKMNRKSLDKVLPTDVLTQLQKLAEQNNLSFSSEKDIAKLFKAYNAL